MPKLGWIKNVSRVTQSWGRYAIPAGMVGLVPMEIVEGLKAYPSRDFQVVSDDPEAWIFQRTEHRPANGRYG